MTHGASGFPFPCLVADVGGTNARFATLAAPDAQLSPMLRLDTGADADFARTARRALDAGRFAQPRSFLLAVAGPVSGREATLTNASTPGGRLAVEGGRLAASLGLADGLLLNDFEALSLALPFLGAGSLDRIGGGAADAAAPMAVVGPGTGLGVGALAPSGTRWLPMASEGGHVSIGPVTADERLYWPFLGDGEAGAEDLLSGRGLSRIYRACVAQARSAAQDDDPAAIAARALAGEDSSAADAARRLLALLARFAGDMALTLGARGGLFIGGGVAPRLLPLLDRDAFMRCFQGNGHRAEYLRPVAVNLIRAPDAALQGLAAVARAPESFALDYAGRRWA